MGVVAKLCFARAGSGQVRLHHPPTPSSEEEGE